MTSPTTDTPRLFLVRHGEFPSNPLGLLDTAVPGERLNETGIAQATAAGDELAARGSTATVVYHSEAARAAHTAELIAANLTTTPTATTPTATTPTTVELPGMFEVQAGVWEKRGDTEALTAYRSVTHGWMDGHGLDLLVDGGETGFTVQSRGFDAISRVRREQLLQGRDAIIVAHGTLNRVLAVMLGAVSGEWARMHPLPNCGIVPLIAHGEGERAGAARWEALDWPDAATPPTR